MLFCEDCRAKKKWPRAGGFPYVGHRPNENCDVCGEHGDCHDVPAIYLVPESERTSEQKNVFLLMQAAYKDKAESLVIDFGGVVNHRLTQILKNAKIERNGQTDWYETYQIRTVLQEKIYRDTKLKRDRRLK